MLSSDFAGPKAYQAESTTPGEMSGKWRVKMRDISTARPKPRLILYTVLTRLGRRLARRLVRQVHLRIVSPLGSWPARWVAQSVGAQVGTGKARRIFRAARVGLAAGAMMLWAAGAAADTRYYQHTFFDNSSTSISGSINESSGADAAAKAVAWGGWA